MSGFWVAAAVISSAVITAGVSVYEGNQQAKAIKNAANDAQARNDKALADAVVDSVAKANNDRLPPWQR